MMGETPKDVHSLMLGDEKAFQVLFVDYYSVLVSFAMKYLDNQDVAKILCRMSS